jgi:hypothetical protein
MATWIERVMTGTGGLNCEQNSATLDQINDGYNFELLELLQAFKED